MDANRVEWNNNFKALRQALKTPATLSQAKDLFLIVHASLHARSVSFTNSWNLEEELWDGLNEEAYRRIPAGGEHSIAWCLWHLARIEDITMNLLLGGRDQVISEGDWKRRLHSPIQDTGNKTSVNDVRDLSDKVAFEALRVYRSAVGTRTREVVFQMGSADIKRAIPPERLQRCLDEGAVRPDCSGMLDYWSSLTLSGLLLMPPTRHALIHLNEGLKIKRKVNRELKG